MAQGLVKRSGAWMAFEPSFAETQAVRDAGVTAANFAQGKDKVRAAGRGAERGQVPHAPPRRACQARAFLESNPAVADALEAEIRRRIREGLAADMVLDGTDEEQGGEEEQEPPVTEALA